MTKNFTLKNTILFVLVALVMCTSAFISKTLFLVETYAEENEVTVTNLNFNSSSESVSYLETTPSGWKKGISNSKATAGVINVNNFKPESYNLSSDENPHAKGADSKVLMINSKSSSTETSAKAQYFENSSDISLNANSCYEFSAWVKVSSNAFASIYLVGLDDKYSDKLSFTQINFSKASEWTEYKFFVKTGDVSEKVKFQLWLGSDNNQKSAGAVFFDNLQVNKLSEDVLFAKADEAEIVDLNENEYILFENGNFDYANGFGGWLQIGTKTSENSGARIMNLSNSNELQSLGLGKYYSALGNAYTGGGYDYSKNNTGALVIYTTNSEKDYLGYKHANNIELLMGDIIKVSVNVKVANSATAVVSLGEVINENSNKYPFVKEENDYLTLGSKQISVSENSDDQYKNKYQTVEFYVKGRSLQNTELCLSLSLGSQDEKSSGIAVFDTVRVERISVEEYNNAETSSYVEKLELYSNSSSLTISNGNFNSISKSETSLTYPQVPENWTNVSEDENKTTFGVVNTNANHFNQNKANYGNISNPLNPQGFTSDVNESNNILMLWNKEASYQTIKSSTFDVEAGKYYSINFDFKQLSTNNILNVYVVDSNSNIIFEDENIVNELLAWNTYKMLIKTYDYSSSLNLVIGLGNEDNKQSGYLFIDNVVLNEESSFTEEIYTEQIKTVKTLDFMSGNFNLISNNGTDIQTALAYTANLEEGEVASQGNPTGVGGIIIGGNNAFDDVENPNNTNSLKNMMIIKNIKKATYSMTAKDSISLEADSCYKFSVDIKTFGAMNEFVQDENVLEEDKIYYGATFGLSGLDKKLTNIIAEDWTTYTIYVKATESTSVKLYFALKSENADTSGFVLFDNYKFEKIETSEYNLSTAEIDDDKTILAIGSTETEETNEEDEEETSSTGVSSSTIWIAIPSIIFGIAIILALVATLMKRFKIKKWEKKKLAEYDRTKIVGRDTIRKEAEELKDKQVQSIKEEIEKVKADIEEIENVHKLQLKAQHGTKITAEIEREFKTYAKKRTAMSNKIISLEKKIENLETPEHLLALQKQIALAHVKEEKAKKELAYQKKHK